MNLHNVWLTSNAATPICGRPEVDVERMYRFVKMHNPEFPREIAEAYYNVGLHYGTSGKVLKTLLKRTQRIDINIICRLIKKQYIALLFQSHGEMQRS